jgi:CO/xanthine dehydrogenase FAD-binding subunit
MATIGGALVSAHPWADIPTALIALGAEVHWQGEREEHAHLEELYWERPFRGFFRGAVLTEIYLPPWEGAFAFEKLTRSAYDIALLNCACGLGIQGGKIAWARVALGATPKLAKRLPWLEQALVGEKPGDVLWEEAGREVTEKAEVGNDRRASAAWRRNVAGVIVCRALARAAEKSVSVISDEQ